jgi:hypothetical protein
MLLFGFELDRGNIARTRVFPSLMWRMVDYLTGQLHPRPPDVLTALVPGVLDVSEPSFSFASELSLIRIDDTAGPTTAPAPRPAEVARLPVSEDRTVLLPPLPAGRYLLQKPAIPGEQASLLNYARHVTVRPDPRESDMSRIDEASLHEMLGTSVRRIPLAESGNLEPTGRELWKWVVVLLILAYAAEAVIGWLLNLKRERQRGLEAA